MSRLLGKINTLVAVCGACIMLFIMFSISYGALTRTLNLPSPIWIVQVNEYSLVWVCFLGTAWVLSNNKHVRVDILISRFDQRKQTLLMFIQDAVSTLLCGVFFYLGTLSTWEHFRDKVMDVGSIDVPKAYIIGVIPLGFLLLTFQFLLRAAEDLRMWKTKGASDITSFQSSSHGIGPEKAGR